MAKATVTLTIGNNPPVTVDPDPIDVDTASGIEIIHWKPARGSKFTFVALIFKEPNPFQNVVVSDDEIIARDNTNGPEAHKYIILVKDDNENYYSSEHATGRAGGTPVSGGGGPTIRNN